MRTIQEQTPITHVELMMKATRRPLINTGLILFLLTACDAGWVGGMPVDGSPTVVFTTPATDAVDVALSVIVLAVFSEAMDEATVDATTFLLRVGGSDVAAAVTYDAQSRTATLVAATSLTAAATYTATITTAVTDEDKNGLETDYVWSFTTEVIPDTQDPSVLTTLPDNNATGVGIGAVISVNFDEPMNQSTLTTSSFQIAGVSGTVSGTGAQAIFTPSSSLALGVVYTATISATVTDLAGNSLGADHVWSFTTTNTPTVITVISTSPDDNDTDVLLTAAISAVLSDDVDPASVNSSTFFMSPGAGSLAVVGDTVTLTPSSALTPNTVYTVTLTTGITDLSGNPLEAIYVWSFTSETVPMAVLTWIAPTTNENATPLTDLAGYAVNFGLTPSTGPGFIYDTVMDIGMPTCVPVGSDTECTHTVAGLFLPGNTYYFAVTAYDTSSNYSDFSNEGSKSF